MSDEKPNVIIPPTLGRIVWFTNSDGKKEAAMVTYVWHDRLINIVAFTSSGIPYGQLSVPLMQGDAKDITCSAYYAEWMPYQKAQAAKHK